ncbi:MAG: APC family permease [candidate division Zixibacteria bacterium]|nr:APC family permease [candidate division Zixibacteria bacterium]
MEIDPSGTGGEKPPFGQRFKRFLLGGPRRLTDKAIFHRLSLVAFLAWVGFGADGLSSSAYGPEEAFRTLGEHRYLAVILAALMAATVLIISAAYKRIIEEFPAGGGGYVVATKLLGEKLGVVSGCALLVDYILTITISLAAAGDALFSFLPYSWHYAKLPFEIFLVVLMTTLNLRGVRESVIPLTPVFLIFVLTHIVGIIGGIAAHSPELPQTARQVSSGFQQGAQALGMGGMLLLLAHAYSLGGGTYTGIEAVSNGLPLMREPRVETAKKTMNYMGASLAFTATGLLVNYLLWNVEPVEGKTLNAVFFGELVRGIPGGAVFLMLTLFSTSTLLVVAAQAGFFGGPRVLANMGVDSWMPHRFAALSDRLTVQNGILLMGIASLAALLYTRGDVRHLVVMYSINVFLTFSLSMLGMSRLSLQRIREGKSGKRRLSLFLIGLILCLTILTITSIEKFGQGGWLTLLATGCVIVLTFFIRRHYRKSAAALAKLYASLEEIPSQPDIPSPPLTPKKPTAVVLVASYGPVGIHTVLNIFKTFPGHFKNLVFLSVGVIDSGSFKGSEAVEALQKETEASLLKYVELSKKLGIPATYRMAIGTDVIEEAEKLCLEIAQTFQQVTYFATKVIFQQERWYHRFLHNETAYAIQRRLQWVGKTMVIIPARVR